MSPSPPGGLPDRLRSGLRTAGRLAFLVLLVLGGLYVVISPGVAERFVFFPSPEDPGPPPALAGIRGEDVDFRAEDGVRLHAWWYDAGPATPAVLLFHGNAGNIAGRTPLAEAYLRRGISIFMLDYRGYGRSEGRPTEEGVHLDAEASLRWLIETGRPPSQIVVHGRSLGGAVGARLVAGRDDLAGVILEATFTTLTEMAASAYPFLPSFLFRRLAGSFDSRAHVRELRIPVLVVHGSQDRLIPPSMGRELFEGAPEPREWFEVPGADHNDVFLVGGERYFDRLAIFVMGVAGNESGR